MPTSSEFYYKCCTDEDEDEETCNGTIIRTGFSGFSDQHEPLRRVKVRCFGEDADPDLIKAWYERQLLCSSYSQSFLRMHFLNLSERRVVMDNYEHSLKSWLNIRYASLEKNNLVEEAWWRYIKEEFIMIFKSVFAALKELHLKGEYHGNLNSDSIKVQRCGTQFFGVLTDMESLGKDKDKAQHITTKQKTDVRKLKNIMSEVINYPFGEIANIEIDEINMLCFSQLNLFESVDITDLITRWALDPVLFWSTDRRIQFLRTVYWLLYRNGNVPKVINNHLRFKSWKVEDDADPRMSEVFYYEENQNQYDSSKSIIKFYRNCLEHLKLRSQHLPNKPEEIHALFLRSYDILSPSTVLVNNMCKQDAKVPSKPYIKCLIESFMEQIKI